MLGTDAGPYLELGLAAEDGGYHDGLVHRQQQPGDMPRYSHLIHYRWLTWVSGTRGRWPRCTAGWRSWTGWSSPRGRTAAALLSVKLYSAVWPHLALELARLQSGGHLHRPRLLQPPVDDEVEGEQRQEGEDGGGRHPGPGRVPHDVVLRAHS